MQLRTTHHVIPWKNWCNDPNGLLFDGEYYHAFYQHYPDAHAWGPMHWGHSRSRDLFQWEHLPIALFPTDNGYCFSGSAIMDKENVSGLGSKETPPYILFYTNHPAPKEGEQENFVSYEEQFLAYSTDGIHFQNYEKNPIIPNYGKPDFRDPKVMWHGQSQRWICALAAGDHIAFYSSPNVVDWEHCGDFGPGENTIPGVWECPDLFPLTLEGKSYWVLIVSMGTDEEHGRCVTQYFIGDFDGKTFRSLKESDCSRLLDHGPDNYAAVSFSGTTPPLMMGWAMNWGYGADTPTEGYVAQLTCARELYLYRNLQGQISLASRPVEAPKEIRCNAYDFAPESSVFQKSIEFQDNAVICSFETRDSEFAFRMEFQNDYGEKISITQDENRVIRVDRSQSGNMDYHPMLKNPLYQHRELSAQSTPGKFTVFLDGPLCEVFADDGTRVLTLVCYPQKPYNICNFSGGCKEMHFYGLKDYNNPIPGDMYENRAIQVGE